jgi:hypothetical protein
MLWGLVTVPRLHFTLEMTGGSGGGGTCDFSDVVTADLT